MNRSESNADDRTVHAECAGFDVVRYDRSGKWYVEPKNPERERELVGVKEAGHRAISCELLGGKIHFGKSGGRTFDHWIKQLKGYVAA